MAESNTTETGDYSIPWVLDDKESFDPSCRAARIHLKGFAKAERRLSESIDHMAVLEGFIQGTSTDMVIHAEAVVRTVLKLIRKARHHIDRQERADLNLFVAYHDLKAARASTDDGG